MRFVLIIVGLFLSLAPKVQAQQEELFSDQFTSLREGWKPLSLSGASGEFKIENNLLKATPENNNGIYGTYYQTQSFDGHFYVDVEIVEDQSVGLVLLSDKEGTPDTDNYTMMYVTTDDEGRSVIEINDKQNGQANVLDNTNKVNKERYKQTLTGTTYSVPFTSTAKKLRIIRHASERFFHFYYAVAKEIEGETAENWMELSPSKEWLSADAHYYVGLVGIEGEGQFDKVTVTKTPLNDRSDVNTGFKATWRDYNWSGYFGDALVITFGNDFEESANDRKFVFWEQLNYIPAWHLNNETQYSYEFVETWGGGSEGCFEPMSDRLLRYSKVELIEDNEVRKVVHWHYVLMDPDYNVPDYQNGSDMPEVDEYYTIYADGSIIREIQYTPKLDTNFRNWHELTEPMVIAGNNNWPKDLLENPALTTYTIFDDKKTTYSLRGDTHFTHENALGPTVLIGHIKDAPDVFSAFSDDTTVPETYSGYQLDYKIDWHNLNLNFAHWPINKEPYREPHKSWADWKEQIAHTSLIGMGVYGGTDWNDNYLERENGRKYRKWSMLGGLLSKNSVEKGKDLTNSWLYSGYVILANDSSRYIGYERDDKTFEFTALEEKAAAYFDLSPDKKLINPVFKINNWRDQEVYINLDGKNVDPSEFVIAKDGDALILLLKKEISKKAEISITSSELEEVEPPLSSDDIDLGFNIQVYPNPVSGDFFRIDVSEENDFELKLMDANGKVILQDIMSSTSKKVSTVGLTKGVYILKMQTDKIFITKRILVL
ncbi:T9SS type A sorting domain-containing protein [Flammeovirga sp. SubArs3]|uniref:T9SS type A sorting domain-containing protein n=1 Tax=Flammeovirga sp. SubArs3 TaxID=2995316 RepID=UPI00248C39E2|nr:T9SS type A sorting domain-containing protein [Flammeovirga sp. SubArs3]